MRIVKMLSVLAVLLVLGTVGVSAAGQVLLNAAGATFPYPIYSEMVRSISPDASQCSN